MTAPINLTPKAEADLDEILTSLEAENPQALTRFVVAWKEQLKRLSSFPELGRPREELAPGLRSIPIRPFVLFYTVTAGEVGIIRILHGHRDIASTFAE